MTQATTDQQNTFIALTDAVEPLIKLALGEDRAFFLAVINAEGNGVDLMG